MKFHEEEPHFERIPLPSSMQSALFAEWNFRYFLRPAHVAGWRHQKLGRHLMIRLFLRTDLICMTKAKRVCFLVAVRIDSISSACVYCQITSLELFHRRLPANEAIKLKRANLSPQLTPLANKPICRSIKRHKNLETKHFFDVRLFAGAGKHRIIATCVVEWDNSERK